MNSFSKHGIDHLSLSTINLFIQSPSKALMKLSGYRSEAGASAARGNGFETAFTYAIQTQETNLEILNKLAIDKYLELNKNDSEEKIEKEKKVMLDCIANAVDNILPDCAELKETQGYVEGYLDGVDCKVIGYYDLVFDGYVVDLKSTTMLPSKPSLPHCRQISFYNKMLGSNFGSELWYITPKKFARYPVENIDKHLLEATRAAQALQRILSYSDDINECCRLVYPDYDHWLWNQDDINYARKIWENENESNIF
jgi:hypothetical protein